MSNDGEVRVRFAPSPTGFLHLGSARTALFNWAYARHTGGALILRIEDTDRERSRKEFLDEILEDLKWLGIGWDEGPFFQSQRFDRYREIANEFLEKGLAYREGDAVIFRVEKDRKIVVNDIVHGEIAFDTGQIKDQVCIKSDGSPAYNFCCVVDDSDMGITHIIRGDDHISNTPKQVLFYEALGVPMPKFAHMPLMMGTDGAKLSKRHGAVAVEEYKKQGFLPEALANYLLLLGWSPGGDREIIPMEEAVALFRIEDIGDVQARFDIGKLLWMNSEYIKMRDKETLAKELKARLIASGIAGSSIDTGVFEKVVELYRTRIKKLEDFVGFARPFFTDEFPFEEKGYEKYVKKMDEQVRKAFGVFIGELKNLEEFNAQNIESVCRNVAESESVKPARLIHPTRVLISGATAGAGLFEMMEALGKDRCLSRMEKGISR